MEYKGGYLMPLTHLSLFSGIGGLDLAAEMAGIVTVGQCEYADYPTKILEKHWKDVPRWRDIRTLTGESFYERTGLRTVDIISGGFPCQPFSVAGKRKGKDDDRYLWDEMFRVIREIRPTWVIGENVPGIVNMALDQVLSDLESEGYTTQAFIIPACGVDAPHRRDRVAIISHSGCKCMGSNRATAVATENGGQRDDDGRRKEETVFRKPGTHQSGTVGMADGVSESVYATASDTNCDTVQGCSSQEICRGGVLQTPSPRTVGMQSPWQNWMDEPRIPRVVDGIPNRVDRVKALGNAVVPQQFYIFFKLIADIENGAIT